MCSKNVCSLKKSVIVTSRRFKNTEGTLQGRLETLPEDRNGKKNKVLTN